MAKKLVYNYTFTPGGAGVGTIVMKGNWKERSIQLITNVTDNIIIYNFAESGSGGTTTYNSSTGETTLTLDKDTSSMSASDELQIFVDQEHEEIEFGESFVDPVHKLRVSTPENLIDTDFEYGLQSSKWETVELVNNIPSIYSLSPGISIAEISNVTTTANTQLVTVICGTPHDLSVGDPIEVRGLTSRTAEGKYLVTNVASTRIFSYKASGVQAISGDVNTAYTTIIPGSFFSASEISYNLNESIETDNADPSTLTITTDYSHGLSTSTSLYITNTVGKKSFSIPTTTGTAGDGDPVVRTSDSSFYIPQHNLYNNQRIFISPSGSGALPSTLIGAPEPSNTTTINTVYNAVKTACDTIQTTMGNDVSRYYMYYTNSDRFPYLTNYNTSSARSVDGGDTHRQYLTYGDYGSNIASYFRLYSSTGQISYYRWDGHSGEGSNILYTGNPVDVGTYYTRYSGSAGEVNLADKGLLEQTTPFFHQQYTPYFITIRQFPDPGSMGDSNFYRNYYYDYSYRTKQVNVTTTNNRATQNVRQSAGSGWYYTYGANYYHPNGTYMGHIKLDILLENDNWGGQYGTSNTNWLATNYAGSYRLWHRQTTLKGSHYRIEVLIPVDDTATASKYGSTGSSQNFAQMVTTIVNQVISDASYPSFENPTGINTVFSKVVDSNRIQFLNSSTAGVQYLFSNQGSGPLTIETDQTSGVADDYYSVTGVTTNSISIGSSSQIAPRVLNFNSTSGIQTYNSNPYIYISGGHGLIDGQKVVFNVLTGDAPNGLTNATTYYAIVSDNQYVGLATDVSDWQSSQNAITDPAQPATASTYNLSVYSISGRVAAAGTIGITTTTSNIVTGYNTKFSTLYRSGDAFIIKGEGTPATYLENIVDTVSNDTKLTLLNAAGITTSNAEHYVDTKINVRADGTFIHRPFDGGVEITAGTSPDSQIVRQTRKYFRYQSGKGIQCSVAINFNPSRPVRTASGSGSVITMTTEYPHGLAVGNTVKISGAEEPALHTPSSATFNASTGQLTLTINNHGFLVGEEISIANNSITFTCDKDSNATNHSYPRSTDPAGNGARLAIRSVTTNTLTVNVGSSSYAGNHTFVSAAANAVTHHDISNNYNGTYEITGVTDFTFTYTGGGNVTLASPKGFIEYAISGYKNAGVRCGLFDFQNGFFYEYDGKQIYAVRRSSVQQLSGTTICAKGSNIVAGTNTRFLDQLSANDMIVLRGQSYKVTDVISHNEIHIQPKYKGRSQSGIIVTKTVDTKVAQYDWNLDTCDGTGPSAFNLDVNKIQMAYFDYSWYGAGKIRFGFKDTNGRVRYVHEFVHNNRLNEAYMRTGNIAGRYEVFNKGIPTYVPSLFHWGTSVIMDGRYDNDDSYLFTASGNSLTFTNGDVQSATTSGTTDIYRQRVYGSYSNYYLRIPFPTADASKFSTGIGLYTVDEQLNGETVAFTGYGSGVFYVYILLSSGYSSPAIYPNVPNATAVSIGGAASGASNVDLNSLIPLISVRLAPSVDNGLIGAVGERDIINRMQLKLKELGISSSHNTIISVILNGNLSNRTYENVGSPSLSQYVSHNAGDTIDGGTIIYRFRASGGVEDANGKRLSESSSFDLQGLSDLGNSILGGDDVFPNGPDVMTICASVVDSSEVTSTAAYSISSRVSWSESQA